MPQNPPAAQRFLPHDLMGNPAHCVSATVAIDVYAQPSDVFDWFVRMDISRVLNGYGPLPAVEQTIGQSGSWTTPGETRHLRMSRGITARQEILVSEPPGFFAYRVSGFTHILDLMAAGAEARWWFDSLPGGHTCLTWRYTFWPRSVVGKLAMYPVIRTLWSWYMRQTIRLMKQLAEREIPDVPGRNQPSIHSSR